MRKFIIYILLGPFFAVSIGPMPVDAQTISLSKVMESLEVVPQAAILKGLTIHPDKPLQFDFIVEPVIASVAKQSQQEQLKTASLNFAKYFLASVAIPNQDMWVNLSPYEKNRIIPASFGQTLMGRDLLAQDYLLKQVTASLIHPDTQLGKEFWAKVYKQAQEKFGTTQIPINTFNKVWIMPDKATVWERNNSVFVVERHLKVMLEEDYLAMEKNKNMSSPNVLVGDPGVAQLGSKIVKEIIIPALEKEVNEGEAFAQLREIYNAMILATWYKKRMKDSFLGATYMNKNKVAGVGYKTVIASPNGAKQSQKDLSSPKSSVGDPEQIYQEYLKIFKKGVFNFIKEEPDPATGEMIPRKYFSGGAVGLDAAQLVTVTGPVERISLAAPSKLPTINAMIVIFNLKDSAVMAAPAMTTGEKIPDGQVKQEVGDAFKEVARLHTTFDLIFVDPPYPVPLTEAFWSAVHGLLSADATKGKATERGSKSIKNVNVAQTARIIRSVRFIGCAPEAPLRPPTLHRCWVAASACRQ